LNLFLFPLAFISHKYNGAANPAFLHLCNGAANLKNLGKKILAQRMLSMLLIRFSLKILQKLSAKVTKLVG
jgi:hypothetical protein